MTQNKIRKKILLNLATNPAVLVPFTAGATGLITSWAFDLSSAVTATSALSLVLSVGLFLTVFFLGGDEAARHVYEQVEKENIEQKERELDLLDKELTKDRDPRTQEALRNLRNLRQQFREVDWAHSDVASFMEVIASIDNLFDSSIQSLVKSLSLARSMKGLNGKPRRNINDQREFIISDIEKNIEQMATVLIELRSGVKISGSEKLRRELSSNVNLAKTIAERISAFESTFDSSADIEDLRKLRKERGRKCSEQSGD